MASHNNTLFSSLPYELFHHILSYGVDSKNPSSRNSIRMVATFQSLNKKISKMKEMQDYFNAFWWKIYENNFGIDQLIAADLAKLRLQMTKRDEMKRKILLASYIKFTLYKQPKYNPKATQEEIKIVMLGDTGVGKSAITIFFVQCCFAYDYDPTIEETYRKHFKVDDKPIFAEILDTATYEDLSDVSHLRFGDAFIIVCASNDSNSITEMRTHVGNMLRNKDIEIQDMPVVFVMNKMDLLDDANKNETIERFRQEANSIISDNSLLNYSVIECSAKNGENIDAIFMETIRKHRICRIDNIALLKGCIEKDTLYFDESKMRFQVKKKCSIM